jgi:DnaJ homolog subfamily C member 19
MGKFILIAGLLLVALLWWQSRMASRRPRSMPASEARRLLGVEEGATLEEIRAAHRRLITRVHPDAGGSVQLAEQVNAARDALVAEMNRRTPRAS